MNKYEQKLMEQFKNKDVLNKSLITLQNNIEIFSNGKNQVIALSTTRNKFLTTLCGYALADLYSQNGEKVLIVETDMHDPFLKEFCELRSDLDFSKIKISKTITKLSSKLSVVFSETNMFSAKVFHSEKFIKLINDAKDKYDHIIMLIAPMLKYNDIIALKNLFDVSLLVAKKDWTYVKDINKCLKIISEQNIPFLGVSLIK